MEHSFDRKMFKISEDAGSSSDEDDPEYLEFLERDSIDMRRVQTQLTSMLGRIRTLKSTPILIDSVFKKGDKTDERTDAQKRRIIRELSREKKWLKMTEVRKSGGPLKNMEDRIWKGVPEKLRIVFWPRLLGVERMKLDNFCVIFILY
ncbi:hypothetical protein CRE_30236 [Caenorhabditis remanei]|uniref:Rab-GAP TBC domain-containing protein n=1 Tax=Caenorhabditis remanei TaxID=31234 RepID=E3NJD5_CAERE|nr:hypothetical protein CRE_30236 [Caenorhabditis remanei]